MWIYVVCVFLVCNISLNLDLRCLMVNFIIYRLGSNVFVVVLPDSWSSGAWTLCLVGKKMRENKSIQKIWILELFFSEIFGTQKVSPLVDLVQQFRSRWVGFLFSLGSYFFFLCYSFWSMRFLLCNFILHFSSFWLIWKVLVMSLDTLMYLLIMSLD